MSSKKYIIVSLSLLLSLLIFIGALTITVDPLFQYHTPWFGLEPVIDDERYQNAGIAKNFDFCNVIIGNSMSENFRVSQAEQVFGGSTVKLVASGSYAIDWSYTLDILQKKETPVKTIMFNLDPYVFNASATELNHDLPIYLYDDIKVNDINYLYNFQIMNDFTVNLFMRNLKGDIPDYEEAFIWDDTTNAGKEKILSTYERPKVNTEPVDENKYIDLAMDNIGILTEYFDSMPETEFVFFYSPFSVLYWDGCMRGNRIESYHKIYIEGARELLKYDNVSVYLWSDELMLDIISDLDYYVDESHYNSSVSSLILERIGKQEGLLTKDNYRSEIDTLFQYLYQYDTF